MPNAAVDRADDLASARLGVPIQQTGKNLLPAAFGASMYHTGPYPTKWHQFPHEAPRSNMDDSLAFGGVSGYNFLERDPVKNTGLN